MIPRVWFYPVLLIAGLIGLATLGWRTPISVADEFPEIYDSPGEAQLSPMPAAEAAATLQLPQGFSATVFAAEPDVLNPIAVAWDDRGRMWVAENFTYAEKTQRFDLSLRDRVTILHDADGDGRAETRKVFTDNVQMLTSVETGKGGVWLMCPPQLLFIPDADGDDVPDGPPLVKLDGFTVAEANYHNFANGLRWGPDGWLYGRCGHSCPGNLGVPGTAEEDRVPIDGGIWRYHPEREIVEVMCHGTTNPWGHDWDEHGELFFVNTVIGHLWHMMPGAHFKESFGESRNPGVYERMDMVADHYHFDTTGSWQESRGGNANDLGGGHAHVGMMIYQGDVWPQEYRGKLFTINMHGMRVNVERLERSGAGYVARHDPDFCISQDPFFRGVELSVGPDRNAYLIDWSDTGECHEHTGVHRTSGRIYKINYGQKSKPRTVLKPFCLEGSGPLPPLWRSYQGGETNTELLRTRLQDSDEHVRVWAIRLLTDFWPLDTVVGPKANTIYPDDPATRAEFVRMAREDSSGLVLLTLASTLQRLPVEHRAELATELVRHERFASDRDLPLLTWYGLIPLAKANPNALVQIARDSTWPTVTGSIAHALAARVETTAQPLNDLLLAAGDFPLELQNSVLVGMSEAFRGWRKAPRPASWEQFAATEAAKRSPETVRELSRLFGDGRAMTEIRAIALDKNADPDARRRALASLIESRPDDLQTVLLNLLETQGLNGLAAQGLALFDDPTVADRLIRSYRRFQANDRPAVIDTLVARRTFANALLNSLAKDGPIATTDITAVHARQIRNLGDESLNRRLSQVWGELRESSAERREMIDSMKHQLSNDTAAANLSAGRTLFNKTCSQCHQMYGEGKRVGPDLTGSQRANLDYLLENILDPSAVVGKDYRTTLVVTTDGRVLTGLAVSQDDKTLVLQTATEQKTIAREEIEELQETPLSPMPDGLLQNLSPQQIRDLIAYLRHPVQVSLPIDSTD